MLSRLPRVRRTIDPALLATRERLARLERRVNKLEREVAEGYQERP
jgi:BMFP domain-containing protein YqiC